MTTYLLGIALVVGLSLVKPIWSRRRHLGVLRDGLIEGAAVVPRLWTLSGLRIERPGWRGLVEFEQPWEGGGHALFRADLGRPTPDLVFHVHEGAMRAAPGLRATGDPAFDARIAVAGDPDFARQVLGAGVRSRVLALVEGGSRVRYIGRGAIEVVGPLPRDPAACRAFLESCAALTEDVIGSFP
ncbi:MAG TPA: hypothetical protein VEJ18_01645 [Planctomycetota bacterium]|nr:hypothetical protein [Planctomycetota bacterium]